MSIISNNIKYLRRLNGLTQEQFARRIGIKRSLLGAYEEARANPNYDNLMVIAKLFGLTIDQLLKEDVRRVRSTPDLLGQSSPVQMAEVVAIPEPSPKVETPKPLATIVEKYFRDEEQIKWMAQKIVPKKLNFSGVNFGEPKPIKATNTAPTALVFNNHYEQDNKPRPQQKPEPSLHQTIQLVRQNQIKTYLQNHQQVNYLASLTTFQLPMLPVGNYRAFESGDDFAFTGALLIGEFVKNWFDIKDGTNYVLLLKNMGIVYRRVYNQVKIKGNLLLSADTSRLPTIEIPINDVLEVWEVKAFLSMQLPQPAVSLERLQHLTNELQNELSRVMEK
jgi:transcriptional regulator with XRE-family HTH domain